MAALGASGVTSEFVKCGEEALWLWFKEGRRRLGDISVSLWSSCPDHRCSEGSEFEDGGERVFDLTGLLEESRTTAGTCPLLQAFAQLAWRSVERQQLLS